MSTPASQTWCPPSPVLPPTQDIRQLAAWQVKGSLCHLKWRPILLTGLLRQLCIQHYSSLANLEDPDLSDPDHAAVWRDTLRTGILIESVHRWRGELVEKRPAILVKRNAYRNMRVAIGDRYGLDGQGFDRYTTLWVGSHTLFCIHGTGASCEILATETQRELTQFGPAIVQMLGLHKFQVTEVGAISEVEESTQAFVVPITVGWAYEESWVLRTEARPLQGINLEINVRDC